jgi:tetratricopeptide (TPR) repeat protein/TolB-like protein
MIAGAAGEPRPPSPPSSPTRTGDAWLPQLAAGARLAGRYRILGLIGVGGMGMVYRAQDEKLDLAVAIKVLRPELARDGQRLERFKQELVLARQVSHPNVVRTHDLGGDGDLAFFTMDFIPGCSLRELLAEEGRLVPERAIAMARQIAGALAAAHAAGVVHRDLKPGNLLVDPADRVAISDFGVARSLGGGGLTQPGSVVGTLDYLSPEQARGEEVDGRADLYALGIVLYEMLTGRLPFSGGSEAEVLAQRRTGSTRDLSSAGVVVPRPLAAIVRRLLQRDPARRFQSAGELLAELDRLRAPRSPVRWRVALAAGAAVVLLVAGWSQRQRIRLPWRAAAGAQAAGAAASARQKGLPAPSPHAVALLPLADETGRPDLAWIASGLPELLGAALAERPGLRVLESDRVLQTLASLKLPPGPPPAAEVPRLAELLDADRLVAGRVRSAGGRLRIDLSLVETGAAAAPEQWLHAEAAPEEAFLLVDRLGSLLRTRLALAPLLAGPAVSRSAPALAAMATGAASLRRGDALAATAALEHAVASDPGYGAAWVQLARAREALGQSAAAREAARRAVASLGAGEGRSVYEARAVEARLSGHPEKAQQLLAQLVEHYPDDADAQVALAQAYGAQGSLDRAAAALVGVVRVAPHHPRAWYLLARYSIEAGNARRAIDDYLVHALVVQNQLGSEEGRAEVLNAFGVGYGDLGETERAAESYRQAAEIRRRIGDQRGYAITLRNLANLDLVSGRNVAAERKLNEALAILQRLGDEPGLADVYNDFGALAEERGDYETMLERYQRALRARRDLGNDLALAQSFGNVGYASYQLGRYDDALVYWRQGLALAEKSGDPGGVVTATQNLGLLELARGDWDEAVKSFLGALRKSRELGMKDATAVSLGYLGRLAQFQGRPAAALASFTEALGLVRELDDRRGVAEFTLAQAEVEIELGVETAAGEKLHQAAALLDAERNREQQADLERLQGEWHLLRGERAAARDALRRAVADAQASHGVVALLAARLAAAQVEVAAGRGRATRAGLEALGAQADALGHALLRLRAAELRGRAALAAGDPARAGIALRAGLELAAQCGGYSGAYRLHLLLARALDAEGQRAEAAAERGRALAEIARLRRDLGPAEGALLGHIAEARDLAD